ncbi:MAG: hypothetical protein C5B51_02850 [Terriglobia bacterium]|nr:MAG: hypothetical protein C5B51_02850 [Terriglobia bacterium]
MNRTRYRLLAIAVAAGLSGSPALAHSRNSANRYETSSGINSTRTNPSTSQVKQAQDELKDEGYYKGPVDGAQRVQMRAAVRQFQRDWKLPQTGRLDQKTLKTLGVSSS